MSDIVNKLVSVLEDHKAENIVTLNIREISNLADSMIICTAKSSVHARSLAQYVRSFAKENNQIVRESGVESAEWILIDFGDILVHVMQEGARNYYNLEQLWVQN